MAIYPRSLLAIRPEAETAGLPGFVSRKIFICWSGLWKATCSTQLSKPKLQGAFEKISLLPIQADSGAPFCDSSRWNNTQTLHVCHNIYINYIPGPSNRSPPATFKSTKASRGDLLEGAGMPTLTPKKPPPTDRHIWQSHGVSGILLLTTESNRLDFRRYVST